MKAHRTAAARAGRFLVPGAGLRGYAILMAVFVFLDARVFLRTIFGGEAEFIGGLLGAVLVVLSFRRIVGAPTKARRLAMAIIVFGLLSAARLLAAGVSWTIVIQLVPAWLMAAVAAVAGPDRRFLGAVAWAFLVAMLLNLLASVAPPDFVAQSLDLQTSYGQSRYGGYGLGIARATGFLPAPGFLSLYASIGVAAALILLSRRKWQVGGLLMAVCVPCGAATGNRTFLLGLAVSILLLTLDLRSQRRAKSGAVLAFAVMLAAGAMVWQHEDYRTAILQRLDLGTLEQDAADRTYGETGTVDALVAAWESPWLGSVGVDPVSGRIGARTAAGLYVQSHSGFVEVMAMRGVIIGALFLAAYLFALRNLWRLRAEAAAGLPSWAAGSLLAALVVGVAICAVEPLAEAGPLLVLVGLGLGCGPATTAEVRNVEPSRFRRSA